MGDICTADIAVAWNVLGGGKFKSPEILKAGENLRHDNKPTEEDIALATVLEELAKELGQDGNLTGGRSMSIIALSVQVIT